MNKELLEEILEELKQEIPTINPVGYNTKSFSTDSNNIIVAQLNTIIKILLKINRKINDIEFKINKAESDIQAFIKGKTPVTKKSDLDNSLDSIEKELDILTSRVKKINFEEPIRKTNSIKDILGPKIIIKNNGTSKKI